MQSELELIEESPPKPQTAWFWSYEGVALFIGQSGKEYPKSAEIEACGYPMQARDAMNAFMKHINPYAKSLIPKGVITTLYYKQIW